MVIPVKPAQYTPISQQLLIGLLLIVSLLISMESLAANLTASVDRKVVGENDTFTLLLRYNEQVSFRSPDLDPLEQDFRVLNKKQSTQFRSVNGNSEYFTDWAIVLSPKRTGTLTIPAIHFGGSRTQPIQIEVQAVSSSVKEKLANEFFFDIRVSEGPAYVQGQILYTEKFYYATSPEGASLSDFQVTDARVQPLGEVRSYQTIIEGQRFGVYERQYAVFPEESGTLVIPGQRFSGRIPNPYDRWSRGQPLSVVSKPIEINVLPIPAEYPQSPWLPSPKVSISETYSESLQNWKVGEPVTRTIRLTAQGLTGSQLPAIALPVVDKLRYYPDQSNHAETLTEAGIQGELEQSMAVVPTAEGRLVLPEIRVPWWNTQLQKVDYAVLPSRTVVVAAATNIQAPSVSGPSAAASQNLPNSLPHPTQAQAASAEAPHNQGIWVAISALLLISNIISVFWLWRMHHAKTASPEATSVSSSARDAQTQKQHWKAFTNACRNNDAATIRSALLQWASLRYTTTNNNSNLKQLTQLKQITHDPKLHAALDELDAYLYAASDSSVFNGTNLLALVKGLENKANLSQQSAGLKSLYGGS